MITIVNQVSSAWFDNKLLRKSFHNETNFNNGQNNGLGEGELGSFPIQEP